MTREEMIDEAVRQVDLTKLCALEDYLEDHSSGLRSTGLDHAIDWIRAEFQRIQHEYADFLAAK